MAAISASRVGCRTIRRRASDRAWIAHSHTRPSFSLRHWSTLNTHYDPLRTRYNSQQQVFPGAILAQPRLVERTATACWRRRYSPSTTSTFDPFQTSSATVLKQDNIELTEEELVLKQALQDYRAWMEGTKDDDLPPLELCDALIEAYMGLEYWSDALDVESFKCRIGLEEGTDEYYDSIHAQGKLWLRQGNFDESQRLYQDSLDYFRAAGNQVQQGHVLISLAGWYFFRDQLDLAMERLLEAEPLLDANPTLLVKCLDNQGLICRSLGDFHEALDKYQQALQVVVDQDTELALHLHVADMLVALEEPYQALEVYQNLLMQPGLQENTGLQGVLWHNIATLHVEGGEDDLALEEFRRALHLKQQSGGEEHPEVGKTWNSLGALHYGIRDEKVQALECFQNALWIARIHSEDAATDPDVLAALQTISDIEEQISKDK